MHQEAPRVTVRIGLAERARQDRLRYLWPVDLIFQAAHQLVEGERLIAVGIEPSEDLRRAVVGVRVRQGVVEVNVVAERR